MMMKLILGHANGDKYSQMFLHLNMTNEIPAPVEDKIEIKVRDIYFY